MTPSRIPNFYQIGPDGGYIELDAMLAGLMDEKLVVRMTSVRCAPR